MLVGCTVSELGLLKLVLLVRRGMRVLIKLPFLTLKVTRLLIKHHYTSPNITKNRWFYFMENPMGVPPVTMPHLSLQLLDASLGALGAIRLPPLLENRRNSLCSP